MKTWSTAALVSRFRRWYADARRAGLALPQGMALATATRAGRPSVRFVLLKDAAAAGFVFYTDTRSRKGAELDANPRAALAFYWEGIVRQIRVEGRVEHVSEAEADRDWRRRPREQQIVIAAAEQSASVASHRSLAAAVARLGRRYASGRVPRPKSWTGYRLVPNALEFWSHRDDRLHRRERFTRRGSRWRRTLLQP